ncbi:hypothetical protein [Martelella alba]|uniref:hypothetical protein n=1 Tax=Martelella alba TaxID=2590451 RepID=UPI001E376ACF|nr:hypothetical protein [Martelella alba]
MKKLLLLMAIPFFSSGEITPEITTPDKFSALPFTKEHYIDASCSLWSCIISGPSMPVAMRLSTVIFPLRKKRKG